MAALLGHALANLLAIGHTGLAELHFHAEAALELAHQHVHLDVAGGGHHHLVGLGVVHHPEGGIFLVEAGQTCGNLILLTTDLGGDGLGVVGLGEGQGVQLHKLTGVTQGVTSLHLVHLANGADVAAHELLDLGVLLAGHHIQTAQLFVVAGVGVHQSHVGGQVVGEHLDKGELAVLVGHRLKDVGGGHSTLGDDELGGLALTVGTHGGNTFQRSGEQVDDQVQQHHGAQAGVGRAAQHGDDGAVLDAGLQALHHLGVGEGLAGEVFVHEFLAGLSDRLHEFFVNFLNDGDLVLGDLDLHTLAVVELEGSLVEHIGDAGDPLVLVPDGDHHGGDVLAEVLAEGIEGRVKIHIVFVHLRDVDQPGHLPLIEQLPGPLGAHRQAALGRAHQNTGVGHRQALHHFTGKIEVTGGVQHVDLTTVIFHRNHRGGDGDLTLDFLGIVVADGVAVGGLTQTVDDAGRTQEALHQSGLSVTTVTQQTDVSNCMRRIAHVCSTP